jgi:polyhydroxyalkanoate synthesis regulator phasin
MVIEAVQAYVNLVNGLSRATREKARSAAHGLLAQAGLEDVANDAEERVAKLTEEILGAGRANRELLDNLVAAEVTKAASRLGFVRSDDLDEVREEIAELRAQLARGQAARQAPTSTKPPGARKPAAPRSSAPRSSAPRAAATTAAPAAKKAAAKKVVNRAPGTGRASSTRPGAAQRLAEASAAAPDGVGSAPDPTAEADA